MIACVSALFGLGFVVLPVLFRQLLPPPYSRHKALLYFAVQTVGLFAVLLFADLYSGAGVFACVSLPIALICLALPWGIMLICRYLPLPGLLRASAAILWANGWLWLFPNGLEAVMIRAYGVSQADPAYTPWPLALPINFSVWTGDQAAYNICAAVLLCLLGIAALLAAAQFFRTRSK